LYSIKAEGIKIGLVQINLIQWWQLFIRRNYR